VAATQKLLIDAFVARAAVSSGEMRADYKSVVINFLLAGSCLMAVETVDALLCVCRHLVFVHHRILKPSMTFSALSRGPDEVGGRLRGFDTRSRPIHKKSTQNEPKGDHNSQEHRTK
jgi:hypothetical protein